LLYCSRPGFCFSKAKPVAFFVFPYEAVVWDGVSSWENITGVF